MRPPLLACGPRIPSHPRARPLRGGCVASTCARAARRPRVRGTRARTRARRTRRPAALLLLIHTQLELVAYCAAASTTCKRRNRPKNVSGTTPAARPGAAVPPSLYISCITWHGPGGGSAAPLIHMPTSCRACARIGLCSTARPQGTRTSHIHTHTQRAAAWSPQLGRRRKRARLAATRARLRPAGGCRRRANARASATGAPHPRGIPPRRRRPASAPAQPVLAGVPARQLASFGPPAAKAGRRGRAPASRHAGLCPPARPPSLAAPSKDDGSCSPLVLL